VSLFLFAITGALSCAPNPARSPRPAASPSFRGPETVSAEDAASGERPPARVVKAPMAGEPAESALAEARLASMTCDDLGDAETVVRKMRAEVDEEFRRWASEQPACWQEYRRRAEEERCLLQRGTGPG